MKERGSEPITKDDASLLLRSPAFLTLIDNNVIQISVAKGGSYINAGPFVGHAIVSPDLTIEIKEKSIGAVRVLYQQAFSAAFRFVSAPSKYSYAEQGLSDDFLKNTVYLAFLDCVKDYVAHGIEAEYAPIELRSSHPRGKVLIKKTIQRCLGRGRPTQLYFRTSAITRSTPLNRLIILALEYIAGISGANGLALRSSARALLFHFDGVRCQSSDLSALTSWYEQCRFSSLKGAQRQAVLELGFAVLTGKQFLSDISGSFDLQRATFMNLEKLFERAVIETARSTLLSTQGFEVYKAEESSKIRYLFPSRSLFKTNPDVVVESFGEPRLLIDAKYRDLGSKLSHDSVYQLIAHCQAFGVSEGWLVGISDTDVMIRSDLGETVGGVKVRVLAAAAAKISALLEEELRCRFIVP